MLELFLLGLGGLGAAAAMGPSYEERRRREKIDDAIRLCQRIQRDIKESSDRFERERQQREWEALRRTRY
jgi:hypothetical protein